MDNLPNESSLKKLLGEIAVVVADLPADLRPSAFSTLLSHRLQSTGSSPQSSGKAANAKSSSEASIAVASFGEYLSGFKHDLKEDEKLLIAISFAQTKTTDNCSTIEVAHSTLKDVGIKLSNAGVFANSLQKKKWVFAVGKGEGKAMKFRVSVEGKEALKGLEASIARE